MSSLKSWLKTNIGWPPGKARIDALQTDLKVAYARHSAAVRQLGAALDAKDRSHV